MKILLDRTAQRVPVLLRNASRDAAVGDDLDRVLAGALPFSLTRAQQRSIGELWGDPAALDYVVDTVRGIIGKKPVFGICRGLQEMNVAFGGSLHPEIRELPGRMNHRMPRLENGEIHPDPKVIFADRHEVRLTPGGAFAKILGCETIRVNSLHGQGILEPGERVVVEGVADG